MKLYVYIFTTLSFVLLANCDKTNVSNSISGEISYNGLYSGQNRTIYIRAYKTNSNATGLPDYVASISDAGAYSVDLGAYTGDLYVSAFMDIDNSGSSEGPTANDILNEGVFADPLGCYGDYTFENGGVIKIVADGAVKDINFELKDAGVIKASFSDTGHCTIGVIKDNVISNVFLHHRHCDVTSVEDTFLLAVPPKKSWFCKLKFDAQPTAQIYPSSVDVGANMISDVNF